MSVRNRSESAPITRTSTVLAFAVAGVLAASAAVAQESTAGEESLGEIVVTAQKRSESLTDVPVAVSVVSEEVLGRAAIFNPESLVNLVPSLTFRKGTSNVNSSLNLRGIGTTTFSSAAEPSVSTVLDGVVLARSGMAFTEFLDVQRIEVLRGPQGTLFGKNSSAGVVQIITRDPGDTFEGYADALVGEGNEYRVRTSLGGPISDAFRGQFSAFYGTYDGNVENVFNGEDVHGYERWGVRGKLIWDLSDAVTVRFNGDYIKADDNCCADLVGYANPTTPSNARVLLPSIAPVVAGDENRQIDNDWGPLTTDTNWGLSAQVDWELGGGATVTSITAYRGWENEERRDGDFRSDAPRWTNGSVPGGDARLHDEGQLDFSQFSQEIRIASSGEERLDYVAGLFYFTTEQDNDFTRSVRRCSASTLPPEPNGNVPCNASSTFENFSGVAAWKTEFENYAVFGNLTFDVTDAFRLLAGARWTNDTVEYSFQRTRFGATSPTQGVPGINHTFPDPGVFLGTPPVEQVYQAPPKVEEDDFSWKAGLQYDITPDLMAYGTYTTGYKGPAFNLFFGMTAVNTIPLAPEYVDSAEIGLKSTLLDGRLVLNLAVFDAKYDGFHANSFITVAGATVSTLTNAGEVETSGAELDFIARPTDDLTFSGGLAYTDAKITDPFCGTATGANLANCQARKDLRLAFSPEWKGAISGEWRLPLGETLPVDVRVNGGYSYQSEINYNLEGNPFAEQDAFGLLDLGFSVSDRADRIRFTVLVKNVTDENWVSLKVPEGVPGTANINNGGFANTAWVRNQIPREADRYWQASVRYNFGR